MQNNEYAKHQYVNIYCATNQFPDFSCCVPHNKPHGLSGLGKNYHMRFDPKLGHGTCEVCHITCACMKYISIIYQPWNPSVP